MSTIITQGSTVIAPQLVDGYLSASPSSSRVHVILGRSEPAVTLRPAGLRRGTLRLLFAGEASGESEYVIIDGIVVETETYAGTSEALSLAAEQAHRAAAVFTLTSTERSSIAMRYVVDGNVSRELEDATRDAWIVSVDYQEVD